MKDVDIKVITRPIEVVFECPECGEWIEVKFKDFESMAGDICDWTYTEIECPECNKAIKINNVDWD